MADEQFGKLAMVSRIDHIKDLGNAAALIRAYTGKFIAKELEQVAKRWGRRFLEEALFLKSYAANKKFWLTDPRWPVKNDNNKGNFKDMRDGSKPALSHVTPQARHHFTRFDQVDRLVAAGESDPEIGYMGRLLALCSLPRTNPGNQIRYKRINGPYRLYMTAGPETKLPFGNFPRLILAWLCTEAVRTQSRVIVLGQSLAKFMKTLGIYSSGGGRDQIRLRNQMRRLFGCSVTLIYKKENEEQFVNSPIATRGEYWWNPDNNSDLPGWNSKIVLGEALFDEIINHPIPIDMNTLTALKRSTLGLDLYLWLVYRTFALRAPLQLSWRQMYQQFGADPDKASDNVTVQNFRREVLRELKKINLAWSALNYTTRRGVLILHPSKPAIPPAQPLRLAE